MKIKIAHFYLPGTDGRQIQCMVFEADAQERTDSARGSLLTDLIRTAQFQYNLAVDKAVLAYTEFGHLKYFGTPDLAQYLSQRPLPRWTHEIDV